MLNIKCSKTRLLILKDGFCQVKLYYIATLAQRTIERQDLKNRKYSM